jgi:hypothetical protein
VGSVGQPLTGSGTSAAYSINQGYWSHLLDYSGSCCGQYTGGVTGNTNCGTDGGINLADITRLIDRVYISHLQLCCEENGDTNGDGQGPNLADITRLIDAVYISKEPTAACQ